MAEALGATAASLQIAELFAKAAIRGYKLIKQLEDAPEEIRRKTRCLEDFCTLCNSCRGAVLKAYPHVQTSNIRPEEITRVHDLLNRAGDSLRSLGTILSDLRTRDSDTRIGLWIKAAKTIVKGKDITAHLHELEQTRSHIQFTFVQHGWTTAIEHSDRTQSSIAELQNNLSQIHNELSLLKQRQERANHEQTSAIGAVHVSLGQAIEGNSSVSNNLKDGFANSQSSTMAMESLIRSGNDQLATLISRIDDRLDRIEASSSDKHSGNLSQLVRVDPSNTTQPVIARASFTSPASRLCPCQRIPITQVYMAVGPVVIFKRILGSHRPGCQYHSNSTKARTREWFTFALHDAYGRTWTSALIQMVVIGTSSFLRNITFQRTVSNDECEGPGFVRFGEARAKVRSLKHYANFETPWTVSDIPLLRQTLLKLHTDLRDDFNSTRDWEGVQTSDGKTLLHALAEIMEDIEDHVYDDLVDLLDSILQLLIQGGTPVDGVMLSRDDGLFHTAISRLAYWSVDNPGYGPSVKLLAKYDVPLLPISPNEMIGSIEPFVAIYLFETAPDLAIEYGCSRICVAVIAKDKYEVKRLIDSGVAIDIPTDSISPLSFALPWTEGFNLLMEAGAKTSQATRFALYYEMFSCFELLFATDQFLFEPIEVACASERENSEWLWPSTSRPAKSFLQFVTKYRGYEAYVPLVCKRLAAARAKLMEAARTHFSRSQLEDLGWKDIHFRGDLIDSMALKTYSKLRAKGIILEMSLWPGTSRTIFHELVSSKKPFSLDTVPSVDAAEPLWKSGFRETDELDDQRMTPLLKTCFCYICYDNLKNDRIFLLLLWFLNHDAKVMIFPDFKECTFVHALAWTIGKAFEYDITKLLRPKTFDTEISPVLRKAGSLLNTQPRDLCCCSCSQNGCSPIHWLVTDYLYSGPPNYHIPMLRTIRSKLFNMWNQSCPEILGGSANFTDFCRLEIFERLGIQHTCCATTRIQLVYGKDYQCRRMDAQPEDTVLATKLEGIMTLYQELAMKYPEDYEGFWETWWKVIEDFVPKGLAYPKLRDRWVEFSSVPIFTDDLEDVLRQVRRHVVRSMEMAAEVKDRALEWLLERAELGF